ncbi:MAG: SDR family NAD(P)-dependent oxidoreductase [Sphingobium sp.]
MLEGRRIILTGGARGIGAATLRAYVAAGARIVSMDVLHDLGRSVVEQANGAGPGSAWYLPCDVSKRGEATAAIDDAVALLGGLDVLVHIAGVERGAPAELIDDDHWNLIFEVNVRGTFHVNQAAFPHLRERGGAIINFGSAAGVSGMAGGAAYSASKGAVLAWSRTCAREWAQYGITVNCIAPAIWTPMYDEMLAAFTPEQLAEHQRYMLSHIPLGGKLGNADRDLSPVMVFMASQGAHFITGQTLPVDGGGLMLT